MPNSVEHPTKRAQSNGVVITEVDLLVAFSNDSSRADAALVQSQLEGINKVTLSEGVAIPARSEIIIQGKVQSKDVSQVDMNSTSSSDSAKHLNRPTCSSISCYPYR